MIHPSSPQTPNSPFLFMRKKGLWIVMTVTTSLAVLLSLWAQYLENLSPCPLCLYTRLLYLLIAIVTHIPLWTSSPLGRKIGFLGARLLLLGALGISFYHMGIERLWWAESFTCKTLLTAGDSFHEFTHQFMNQAASSCHRMGWMLFGLSAATWSTLFSGFLLCLLERRKALLRK